MSSFLPPGFTPIVTVKANNYGYFSVIGVVVDCLEPKESHGSSFVSTFTLKDADFHSPAWTGFKVRCFHDALQHLPAPSEGDVVLLRNLKLAIHGSIIGLSSQAQPAPWTIFRRPQNQRLPPNVINQPNGPGPNSLERAYALNLFSQNGSIGSPVRPPQTEYQKPNTHANPGAYTPPTGRISSSQPSKRFALIKDACFGKFMDIVGQVVKTYPEGDRFTLYVTDYTQNKNLYNYPFPDDSSGRDGDEFNYIHSRPRKRWPGPFGQMTLQITLWQPHAWFAHQNVKEDDFVHLQNVQVRPANVSGMMEGAIRTDRMYPDKVQVRVIDRNEPDALVKDVVKRKMEYWRGIKAKRPFPDAETTTTGRKEPKKKQTQKKHKIKPLVPVKRDDLNTHIRAQNPAVPCTLIRDILHSDIHTMTPPGGEPYQLPFQNLRYRSSVRVVDFFPPNLEDFAVPYNSERAMVADKNKTPDSDESDEDLGYRKVTMWEWRFCLLVEDGGPGAPPLARGQKRERMQLFVADPDSIFLLGLDAVDLRENPETLSQLRETLFILWGDLEERKSADPDKFDPDDTKAASAMPFTCCIQEYGVKLDHSNSQSEAEEDDDGADDLPESLDAHGNQFGWDRRFRMFGTTIQ